MEDLHCGYWVKIPKSTRAKSVPVNNGRCSACGSWDDRTDTTDTGSAANVQRPDIDLTLHDNVALITPLTDVAQTRVSEHLEHEESRWWGPALAVERRYLGPIVAGMADEGLVVIAG